MRKKYLVDHRVKTSHSDFDPLKISIEHMETKYLADNATADLEMVYSVHSYFIWYPGLLLVVCGVW